MNSFELAYVSFNGLFKGSLLQSAYASQQGIESADADVLIGRSSDVRLCNSRVGGTHRYVFWTGSGDCVPGCIHKKKHRFDVTPAGQVTRSLLAADCEGVDSTTARTLPSVAVLLS